MKLVKPIFFYCFLILLTKERLHSQNIYFYFADGTNSQYVLSGIGNIVFGHDTMYLNKTDGSIVSLFIPNIKKYDYSGTPNGINDVTIKETETDIAVYPSPSNGNFEINLTRAPKGLVMIQILDLQGQLIEQRQEDIQTVGNWKFKWNMNSQKISTGIFLCRVITNEKVITKKIFIAI